MLIIDQLRKGDRPLQVLALGVFAGLVLLWAGLWYVQVFSAGRYRASQISQSFRTVRIPAIRGKILDAHRIPLADNHPSYNANLYLEELRPHFQAAYSNALRQLKPSRQERTELGRRTRYQVVSDLCTRAAAALQQPVGLNEKQFHEHYDQRLALPLPLLANLTPQQIALFVEQAAELPGLELDVQPLRAYPFRTTAAHALGYLQRDDRSADEEILFHYRAPDFRGAAGLELTFDDYLRGKPGLKSVLVNNLGYRQAEEVWTSPEPGWNVVLTVDAAVQRAAEQALASAGAPARGAVVVLDPRNGDLLALASSPAFDPNLFVSRLSLEDWASLNDETLLPLINRATYGAYAPGSIFKLVVALAALEAGTIRPAQIYRSPGYYQLGSGPQARRIKDEANGGLPAEFDFKKALKQSSNAYFVHHGLLTGPDAILDLAQRLHLGERTGIPIGQEVPGTLPTRLWQQQHLDGAWHDGDTANLAIGQGYLTVTPLQMALLTAAVANGGTVFWPRLVARLEPAAFRVNVPPVTFPAGRVRDQVGVSQRTLAMIQEAMLADVEDADGTGRRAQVPGMRICAKTGTAQVMRGRQVIDHHTWFVSYAPYGAPRYVVVVLVESGTSGGLTCAPVAQQIYLALQRREQRRPPALPAVARQD